MVHPFPFCLRQKFTSSDLLGSLNSLDSNRLGSLAIERIFVKKEAPSTMRFSFLLKKKVLLLLLKDDCKNFSNVFFKIKCNIL